MGLTVGTNSYISRNDANTYFSDSIRNSSWSALSDLSKDQALVTATRMLERQVWAGTKTGSPQTLSWPRTGVTDSYGNSIDSASVPQAILDAECELALSLTLNPSGETNASNSSNIKRVSATKGTDVEFFRPIRAGRFPTIVQELVGPLLGSKTSLSVGGVYGNDGCSSFSDDPYGLSGGL